MINLHYEIRICQKICNRVTMTVYVKCVVRFNVHKTFGPIVQSSWLMDVDALKATFFRNASWAHKKWRKNEIPTDYQGQSC